jgi:hypothetical protein
LYYKAGGKSGTFVKSKGPMKGKICIPVDLEEAAESMKGRGGEEKGM